MRLRPYLIVGALAAVLAVTANATQAPGKPDAAPGDDDTSVTAEAETRGLKVPEPTTEEPEPTADPPATAPTEQRQSSNRDVDCSVQKCIALTYDDGPGPQTMQVADAFSQRGQRATFFVVGNRVGDWPNPVSGVVAQGHELGLHTWDHSSLPSLGADGIRQQLQRTAEAVRDAGGGEVELFRPPFGDSNATVRSIAADLGLSEVLWSLDTLDWSDRDTNILIDRVLEEAQPGAIVLMHDIQPTTADATAKILDGLMDQGYVMVTVSELVGDPVPGESYRSMNAG